MFFACLFSAPIAIHVVQLPRFRWGDDRTFSSAERWPFSWVPRPVRIRACRCRMSRSRPPAPCGAGSELTFQVEGETSVEANKVNVAVIIDASGSIFDIEG
ncbi:unnamed protein product, partial [Ectocarpus sp. 13 AM-2016]